MHWSEVRLVQTVRGRVPDIPIMKLIVSAIDSQRHLSIPFQVDMEGGFNTLRSCVVISTVSFQWRGLVSRLTGVKENYLVICTTAHNAFHAGVQVTGIFKHATRPLTATQHCVVHM